LARIYQTTKLAADVTLPAATITVVSTAGFGTNGRIVVGNQVVTYTGVTPTSFTGCTGGAGSFTALPSPPDVGQVYPANFATAVSMPNEYNLQYPGDTLTLTAKNEAGIAPGATSVEVYDDKGVLVGAPISWSGTSKSLGTAGVAPFNKLGHFTVQLIGPDRGDSKFSTDYGTCRFVIAEDVASIPKAHLRTENRAYISDGVDAPRAHGLFSLGNFRVSASPQTINTTRQATSAQAASAKSVSATLTGGGFGGIVTIESVIVIVHAVVGDATGMAPPPGFTVDATETFGNVTIKLYRLYANGSPWTSTPFPSFSCTTTNNAQHWMWLEELGPGMKQSGGPLSVSVFHGNGNSATMVKDMTAAATGGQEYAILAVVAGETATVTSQTSTPPLTSYIGVGGVSGTQDSFGGGVNHSVTHNFTAVTNWVGFVIAYPAVHTYASMLAAAKAQIDARWEVWGQYPDVNRVARQIMLASEFTSGNSVLNYAALITQLVTDLQNYKPNFIGAFTGRNEPQFSYSIAENTNFCNAVHAAGVGAKAATPGFVSLSLSAQPQFFGLVDAGMYAPGAADHCNYHGYNMSNADPTGGLAVHRALRAGLVSRGLGNLQMWMGEGSMESTFYPGTLTLAKTGHGTMLNTFIREIILKVPYERCYEYYDERAGYDAVTTWYSSANGPYLYWPLHRAFARELTGKLLTKELSFGTWTKDLMVGGVWTNPVDGTSVVGIMGQPGLPNPTLVFGGSSVPATVVTVDGFGNTTTVSLTAKTLSVAVGDTPVYVRVPAGVTVDVRPRNRGASVLPRLPVSFADSGDIAPVGMIKLADNDLRSSYAYGNANLDTSGSLFNTKTTVFPRTITALAVRPVRGDVIGFHCPRTWQGMGVPLKGSIEYSADGTTFVAPPSNTWDNSGAIIRKNYDLFSDTMADIYGDPQTYFEFPLGSVQTIRAIRINVEKGSRGYLIDVRGTQPLGSPNAAGFAEGFTMSEIFVLNDVAHDFHPVMVA
jgi:hypothetical protein